MNSKLKIRMQKWQKVDLYPVITPEFCKNRDPLLILDEVMQAGAKVVQLRIKQGSDHYLYNLSCQFRALTNKHSALLIINDRIDIAMACGADGVHLGQDDLPLGIARKLAPDLIIGTSTHNAKEVIRAQKEGCSYLNIGPVYGTATKELPINPLGEEKLSELTALVEVPFTVMGGIKRHNIPRLKQIGTKIFAVVTAVTAAPDVKNATRELIDLISS
ncbi:MAG: thiamine phosphate synthase [Deltaproteobacteria bacterium]|jgi:thiamine-phosphate pyrophosphorylase|nr:thiamine phosphate synthase [Deltaproteobacteria bacterium]